MNDSPETPPSAGGAGPPVPPVPRWRSSATAAAVSTITQVLLAAAAAWFLLRELAPLLRPLLIAIFLAYVLMPTHVRLRRSIGSAASLGVLAGVSATLLVILGLSVYASVLGLSDDLPRLQQRAGEWVVIVEGWFGVAPEGDGKSAHARVTEEVSKATGPLLNLAAAVFMEACIVALYLMFILVEGSRFPDRVRRAYKPERGEAILQIAGEVNSAVVTYLGAKVRASLVLAIPVGVILWLCGVKFALLWLVLTFLCNFIPYIGPVTAYTLPVGFAFLWFGVEAWQPITAAALLLACHVASAAIIEPTMIGRAVGLSPLVLLASLAFWGLLWGIAGMFLAVPLTVVTTLVLNHFESTRPIARMLCGE